MSSADDNMKLWHSVEKTDPQAVKPITGKSYKGNSPKPYWLIKRATEFFGPVGIGWGCTVKSERFERISDTDVLHVATVSVWYVWDGKRSETFDQMGGTKAAYKTSSGSLLVDEDAGKKSVTDGMVKCLSMIGFAGDIFSGRWDDSKYVKEVGEEFRAEERAAAAETPRAEALPASTAGKVYQPQQIEALFSHGRAAAQQGHAKLKNWWEGLSPDDRRAIGRTRLEKLQSIANEMVAA